MMSDMENTMPKLTLDAGAAQAEMPQLTLGAEPPAAPVV